MTATAKEQLHRRDFRAMGCAMSAWIESHDEVLASQLLAQVEATFTAAEARMSRFRSASELGQLNRESGQWVSLSRPLEQVIELAMELAAETDGLFDPTLLRALEASGYDRTFDEVAPNRNSMHTLAPGPAGSWQQVEVDRGGHRLRAPKGVALDLGGVAKGYTAQSVVNWLSHWGPCLVDAGGDLVAGDAPQAWPGWPVAVAAPWNAGGNETDLLTLWLNNGALATSGIDYRRWQVGDRLQHHIIDPRSGEPAKTDLLTASMLAADACQAEAWSTALLILGKDGARAEAARRMMAAVLVDQTHELWHTPAIEPYLV